MIKHISLFIFFIFLFPKIFFAEDILSLEDNFFPEGITVSIKGDIYVGSLKENKIVKFKK